MPGRTINLRGVDESLYRGLKVRAAEEGIYLRELVLQACREYLGRKPGHPKLKEARPRKRQPKKGGK